MAASGYFNPKEQFKHVFTNPLTPLSFLKRSELVFPEKVAVVDKDKTYTWREFAKRVYRFASALKAQGVKKNDRVAIMSKNNAEFITALYGVGYAGGVSVLVNYRCDAKELAYILNHSGSRIAIIDDAFVDLTRQAQSNLTETKYFIDVPDPEYKGEPLGISFEDFLNKGSDASLDVPVTDELDMLSMVYTSGTTGMPKGCVHTHRGSYLNALGEAIEMQLHPNSAYLWTLPMFHCQGWGFVWAVTAVGAKHVCLEAVRPEAIYKLVEKEGVTTMCGAPTVYLTIANYMKDNKLTFSKSIKGFIGGAAPSPAIIRDSENINISLTQVYGLTEVYGPHTLCEWNTEWDVLPLEERAKLKARQGVPYVTCTRVKVVDDNMDEVPHDGQTSGEIVMQGNNVMMWYFNEADKTDEAFAGGWFHSGDGAVIHPNGYIEIVDRIKDLIITGGENVSSLEVEKVIMENPAVADVAVYAKPDEKWGEIVKALIQLKPNAALTSDEITKWCKDRLSKFKVPREVEFGEVKRTSTGKVQKNLLKKKEIEKMQQLSKKIS